MDVSATFTRPDAEAKVKLSMDSASAVHLVECPRDAMQGLAQFIPTADKIRYLNALLRVGFLPN